MYQEVYPYWHHFPQLSWEKCLQQVQAMNLPLEVQAKFLGENARRVFRLDEANPWPTGV